MDEINVKESLRELGEPITLFGETKKEREKRLEKLLPQGLKEEEPCLPLPQELPNFKEMNPLQNKFFLLKEKMKSMRESNLKEVVEESNFEQKKRKRKQNKKKRKRNVLGVTAEQVEWEAYVQRKKNKPNPKGWEVYSDEFKYKSYKKKCKKIPYTMDEYKESKKNGNEDYNSMARTTDENKERMSRDLLEQMEKRKKFNRRRTFYDEKSGHINEKNRYYNRKIDLAFGSFTTGLKQSLEKVKR